MVSHVWLYGYEKAQIRSFSLNRLSLFDYLFYLLKQKNNIEITYFKIKPLLFGTPYVICRNISRLCYECVGVYGISSGRCSAPSAQFVLIRQAADSWQASSPHSTSHYVLAIVFLTLSCRTKLNMCLYLKWYNNRFVFLYLDSDFDTGLIKS